MALFPISIIGAGVNLHRNNVLKQAFKVFATDALLTCP